MSTSSTSQWPLQIAQTLSRACTALAVPEAVSYVYNPLDYAWRPHSQYLKRYGLKARHTLWVGMNPGPFGMAQTGVPFGEITAVRDWMGIEDLVDKPKRQHPKRLIEGFACERSEVSGRRLWGFAKDYYGEATDFFAKHMVLNYCPLVYMSETGKNITPDKLKADERNTLFIICDTALANYIDFYKPRWVIGVGVFAENRIKMALAKSSHQCDVGRILHPSPASPIANQGWAPQAQKQLDALGVL